MYNNGVMGVRVLPTYRDIVLPILMFMGLQISAPYTWASGFVWALGEWGRRREGILMNGENKRL